MQTNPVLVLRVLQGVLALIAMALGATGEFWRSFTLFANGLRPVANVLNMHRPAVSVPTGVVFFVFTAVFTLLVTVPYTILTPRYFPVLAHPLAMLAAEAITSVFWLGGFAALADRLRKSDICEVGACASTRGSVVVGTFEL